MNAAVYIIRIYLCYNIKQAVISYHEILCHDMSYVTTIIASLIGATMVNFNQLYLIMHVLPGGFITDWHSRLVQTKQF